MHTKFGANRCKQKKNIADRVKQKVCGVPTWVYSVRKNFFWEHESTPNFDRLRKISWGTKNTWGEKKLRQTFSNYLLSYAAARPVVISAVADVDDALSIELFIYLFRAVIIFSARSAIDVIYVYVPPSRHSSAETLVPKSQPQENS